MRFRHKKFAAFVAVAMIVMTVVMFARLHRRPVHSVLAEQPAAAVQGTPEVWIESSASPKITGFPFKPTAFDIQHEPPIADNRKALRMLAHDLRIIRHTSKIPTAVKRSYSQIFQDPFEMVDPSQKTIPGVINNRLVFCGLGENEAVLVYEYLGEVDEFHAIIFWFGHPDRASKSNPANSARVRDLPAGDWMATISKSAAYDLGSLREAVRDRHYIEWHPIIF